MKTITQKALNKMSPADVRRELKILAHDYPTLKDFLIDAEGNAVSNIDAHTLLTMFRNPLFEIKIITGQIKTTTSTALDNIFSIDVTKGSDEENTKARFHAIALLYVNITFAEALMSLAQDRKVKSHVWGGSATNLLHHLDAHPDVFPELKKEIYNVAEFWFKRTIEEGKDGLNSSLDGLARLMYMHHPENDADAVEKSIALFTQAAAKGYLPSMDTLADLVTTEGALTPAEHLAAVAAIQAGAQKTPEGSGVIMQKLAQGGAPDLPDASL